jgi:PAS domain S-box-containing protein
MNEELRLQVVKQFERLNLKYDQELQDTISIAAKICQTPISSITILDKDTQWLKIKKGVSFDQTPRNHSFCTHAIKRKALLVIGDTLLDARFSNNPYVTNGPKIRFYAGYPLITHDNHPIGTLCIMDYKPRLLNTQQKLMLKILAKHAIGVMELKLSLERLGKSINDLKLLRKKRATYEIKLRVMFESLSDAYFLLGKQGEVIDFNRAAYNFVSDKYGVKLSYGRVMTGFLTYDYREIFTFHYQNALNGKRMQLERLANYGNKGLIWWDCIFEPVKNDNDEIIAVSYVARNINDRKLYEEKIKDQNRLLSRIAEIQSHDYRGPVATILGLMNLIELDDYKASKEYLVMMQSAVKKLDEKIHDAVNIIAVNIVDESGE